MQLDGRVAIKVNEKILDKYLVNFEYLTYIININCCPGRFAVSVDALLTGLGSEDNH
jgi:hypothetical protein